MKGLGLEVCHRASLASLTQVVLVLGWASNRSIRAPAHSSTMYVVTDERAVCPLWGRARAHRPHCCYRRPGVTGTLKSMRPVWTEIDVGILVLRVLMQACDDQTPIRFNRPTMAWANSLLGTLPALSAALLAPVGCCPQWFEVVGPPMPPILTSLLDARPTQTGHAKRRGGQSWHCRTPAFLPIFGSYKKSLLRHGTLSEHGFALLSND